eukprot:TRINITY_DN6195_c0_g6_i1.p1 TRINITY_DN6195_c0_g6~~TRINITY_DN6195_c0_g6_i1.p1  ORF type:complete len:472 (-),score=57.01 TRINITY_DN6195_c0_g6_i1:45-1460(-)
MTIAIGMGAELMSEDILQALSNTEIAVHATVVEYRHGLSVLCAQLSGAAESTATISALVNHIEQSVGNDLYAYLSEAEQAVHGNRGYGENCSQFGNSRASSPERTGPVSAKKHLQCTAASVHLANDGLQRLLGMHILGRLADAVDALQEVGVEVRRVAGNCAVPLLTAMHPVPKIPLEKLDKGRAVMSPIDSPGSDTSPRSMFSPWTARPVKAERGCRSRLGSSQRSLDQSRDRQGELVRIATKSASRELLRLCMHCWRKERRHCDMNDAIADCRFSMQLDVLREMVSKHFARFEHFSLVLLEAWHKHCLRTRTEAARTGCQILETHTLSMLPERSRTARRPNNVGDYLHGVRKQEVLVTAYACFSRWRHQRAEIDRKQVQGDFGVLKTQLEGTLAHEAELQKRLSSLMTHVDKLRVLAHRTQSKEMMRERTIGVLSKVHNHMISFLQHEVLVVWREIAASSPIASMCGAG